MPDPAAADPAPAAAGAAPVARCGGGADGSARAGVLATAGFLIAVQAIAGASAWLLSPLPLPAALLAAAYAGWCWLALRATWLLGGRPRWWRLLAAAVWQAPALLGGAWTLGALLGLLPRFDIAAVVLQTWLLAFAPLCGLLPRVEAGGAGLYLWVLAALPFAILAAAARRRAG